MPGARADDPVIQCVGSPGCSRRTILPFPEPPRSRGDGKNPATAPDPSAQTYLRSGPRFPVAVLLRSAISEEANSKSLLWAGWTFLIDHSTIRGPRKDLVSYGGVSRTRISHRFRALQNARIKVANQILSRAF